MMENLVCDTYVEPFPHLIIKNFYNEEEVELIWEELNFYTKPGKLLEAQDFGGIIGKTNSHAIILDQLYRNYTETRDGTIDGKPNYRTVSNILNVTRKIFNSGVIDVFSDIHDCCSIAKLSNWDATKVRYYHNGEYYEPHTDKSIQFLGFYYIHKEPKKFSGGEVFFPKYDYEYSCDNNSIIIFPGWVEHGVKEIKIENSDYYDGWGRYAITSFFGNEGKYSQGDREQRQLTS